MAQCKIKQAEQEAKAATTEQVCAKDGGLRTEHLGSGSGEVAELNEGEEEFVAKAPTFTGRWAPQPAEPPPPPPSAAQALKAKVSVGIPFISSCRRSSLGSKHMKFPALHEQTHPRIIGRAAPDTLHR